MPTKPTTNVGITTVPVGVVTSGPKVGQTTYVRVHLNADSQTLVANGKAVRTRQFARQPKCGAALYGLHRRNTVDWINPEEDGVLDSHKPAQFFKRVLMG
ncbi:MAG: hypothetical protein M1815_002535 [Lichina confinis]|nr:MAG: hypothetical protein M1815_002535 [Lichina confinis]